MHTTVAVLIAGVLVFLSALHVFWAFGGRIGMISAVPSRDGVPLFSPSRTASLTVAAALFAAGYIALEAARITPLHPPRIVVVVGCVVLALVFVGRAIGERRYIGFFKRVRGTTFAWWDSRVYSPLCAALGLGFVVLAIGAW